MNKIGIDLEIISFNPNISELQKETDDDIVIDINKLREELQKLSVEGWEKFDGNSPHRPWVDHVKIKHPETGLIGTRIPDVGNPWLDAGIVPFSTLNYFEDKKYWDEFFRSKFSEIIINSVLPV